MLHHRDINGGLCVDFIGEVNTTSSGETKICSSLGKPEIRSSLRVIIAPISLGIKDFYQISKAFTGESWIESSYHANLFHKRCPGIAFLGNKYQQKCQLLPKRTTFCKWFHLRIPREQDLSSYERKLCWGILDRG